MTVDVSYFVQPTGTILTKDNLKNPWNNNLFVIEDVKQGDIYKRRNRLLYLQTIVLIIILLENGNIDTGGNWWKPNWIKINMKNCCKKTDNEGS